MFVGLVNRLARGSADAARAVTTRGKRGALAALVAFVAVIAAMTPALALAAVPTVTAVSPNRGPTGGGATVIITGSGFSTAPGSGAVMFGAATAASYTVNGDTQITVTAPANAAGIYDVTVTNPDGTSATNSGDVYTYVAAPTVTSLSPVRGPTSGGTAVVITGSGFTSADPTGAVRFGAASATYVINSNTQITATSPASPAGTHDVTITTSGGTSATSASDLFTYISAPTVTGVSPAEGPTAGGTTVIISGTGFAYANPTGAVKFGGTDATYVINTNTQITATAPAGAAGVNDIVVTTPGGTSSTSSADQYAYVAPPIGSSQVFGSIVPYNAGADAITTVNVALYVSGGTPTSYAVGSATTAQGGSVSINSAGQASYVPPRNYRNANDSFTYTASNAGGTSSPRTITLTVGNPTFAVTLPAATGAVGVAYNSGAAAVTMSGGLAPYSNFSASGLPAGLTMDSSGVISGVPTTAMSATVDVSATDSSMGAGPYSANASANLTIAAPTITLSPASGALTGGQAATTYGGQTITATGSITPFSFQVSSGSLPPGLTLASTGQISGTPTGSGTYNFTITATDNSGNGYTGASTYSITVAAPTITLSATNPSNGTVAAAYSHTFSGSGGVSPLSFSLDSGTLPNGLSLASSGALTGTPTAGGAFSFTVKATDSTTGQGPYSGTQSYSLTIAAPTITLGQSSLPNGMIAVGYNQTVTASGGTGAYTFAVTAGSLPPGMNLSSSGGITGTPTGAGTYNFVITATDSSTGGGPDAGRYTGAAALSITVAAPDIFLTSPPLPTVTVGLAYNTSITATGGTAPYTYALTVGSLPAGLNLSTAGVISGTPTAGGTYHFTIKATDSSTGTNAPFESLEAYSMVVQAPTITLSPSSVTAVAAGTYVSQTITASGGTSSYTYAVTGGSLPNGVSLSASGDLSGTPTAVGTFNFTITASDSTAVSGPYTGSQAYSWTIGTPTVTVDTTTVANGRVGANYQQSVIVSNGVGPYTYSIVGSLPAGLAVGTVSGNGAILGTPTEAGTFNFTFTATDSSTGSGAPFMGSRNFTLTIAAPTLSISPTTLGGMAVGQAYSETISATGGTSPFSYAVQGSLPVGLTLSTGGVLSGTPTAVGTYNFTITGTDVSTGTSAPFSVSQVYNVTTAAPTVSLTPSSLPAGVAGGAYSRTLTANGGSAPYTYTLDSGSLPAGLSLSTGGVLSGTPTASGSFTFALKATDSTTGTGSPFSATNSYTLTIAAPTVTLSPSTLQAATQSETYAQAITASGGVAPYAYSVSAGALPAGLTLSSTGAFSGAPTGTGAFNFTVRVQDSSTGTGPAVATQAYSLTVQSPSVTTPPVVIPPTPPTLPQAPYGTAYTRSFAATGGTAPYRYVLTGALPAGLTFDTTTGMLSGVPTQPGTFPFTVTATDATGRTTTVSTSLEAQAAEKPVVVPVTIPPVPGQPVVIDLSDLIDGFYDSIVITIPPRHGTVTINQGSSMPPSASRSGLMASIPSGRTTITYTPNPGYIGPDSFSYAATGPGGTSAPASISLSVTASAPALTEDAASTPANSPVEIAVTANDTGPVDTIAIATAPAHGTAVVSDLKVTYTPAPNYFGPDSFTYTATGAGGVSSPGTVKVTVTPLAKPTQTAQVLSLVAGRTATLAATLGATGSPFTTVAVAAAPAHGVATVSGLNITYTPTVSFSGADTFTYVINNPFGASTPIPVAVTVNPAPLTAPPITVEVLAGQDAVVDLTANASGGPFTGAAVATITPTESGKAVIASPASGRYVLTFSADNAFSGKAVITYTLSNAFATSAPGTINVIVTGRPDPTKDPEVKGLIAAQSATAIRFADAQISNFNRRLEQLHNGGGAGRGFGVSVQGGNPYRTDGIEARERQRHLASLGLNDATDPARQIAPLGPAYRGGGEGGGSGGQGGPKRWNAWASGSADFGMRDALGSQSGFRFTTDGLTAGADYRVGPNLAVGFGLGYGHDSSRIGKLGTKSRAEGYSGGLYASFQPGESTFIDGLVGAGTLDFNSRRHDTVTGKFITGDRDGDQLFAALTFGMEKRRATSMISPYGRVAFSRSNLNAFTEVGGGSYGLTYHDQSVRSLTGTLGLRGTFSRKVSAGLLSPRFRVEYSHDFEGGEDARVSYADWMNGPVYRLAVNPIDRNQLRLELGADLRIQSGLTLGLDFDNSLSKDSNSQGLRLTIQSPF